VLSAYISKKELEVANFNNLIDKNNNRITEINNTIELYEKSKEIIEKNGIVLSRISLLKTKSNDLSSKLKNINTEYVNAYSRKVSILDQIKSIEDQMKQIEEYENELRFCSIHKNEKGEFEEIVSKFKDSITLFFYKYKNHPEFQTIFQKSNITMESLVFGFKIKLFNEYMSEYIHKMFYDKKNKSQRTSFVTFYDECISDYKTILSFENKKQKSLLISKDIQTILFKWNEYSTRVCIYKQYV
jgi:hypothetical protein